MNTSELIDQMLERLDSLERSCNEQFDGTHIHMAFLDGICKAIDVLNTVIYEWHETNTSEQIGRILETLDSLERSSSEKTDGTYIHLAFLDGISKVIDVLNTVIYEWDEMNSSFDRGVDR